MWCSLAPLPQKGLCWPRVTSWTSRFVRLVQEDGQSPEASCLARRIMGSLKPLA